MKMKERPAAALIESRKRLARQMPDPSPALTGSLLTRMVRCNKPGCRVCQRKEAPGHGPISLLAVRLASGRVRQIPVPKHLLADVEAGLQRFAEIQKWLKQIVGINLELLLERKKTG
jgi:hypothetical protein